MTHEQEQFVVDVLRFFDEEDLHDYLRWTVSDIEKPLAITFWLNCNDLFWWGCADAEDITPESLPALMQAVADLKAIDSSLRCYGIELYACRRRKMRPQTCILKKYDERFRHLFEACGPFREVDISNGG